MKNKLTIILLAVNFLIYPFFPAFSKTVLKEKVEKNVIYVDSEWDPITGFFYKDLVELSMTAKPTGELAKKLNEHLNKTFVVNKKFDATLEGKNFIRVAHWNINRGINLPQISDLFIDPASFEKQYASKFSKRHAMSFKSELYNLAGSDIICVNEADVGMPRTQYRNIISSFASSLGWNYAYSTEFVELGPIFQKTNIDSSRYRGLHGNAILSKYPIVSSRVIRIPNCYDWYGEEVKPRKSPLEYVRSGGAFAIFSQRIEYKEVRHGSRSALVADIKLPNDKIITVVSTHLEDRAFPDKRLKQFKYLLNQMKDIKNPVILSGDFNTSTTDTAPTSAKKEWVKRIRDPHFILRFTGSFFVPGLPIASGLAAITFSKLLQYKDPFFPSIPVVFPNPERKFYAQLKKFRFSDGNKFDLRGEPSKSFNGKAGLLANSNQRHWKGFKSTYKLEKPRVVAYFKLDWFCIKPIGEHFAPFNGRTLKTLNKCYPCGLSDHNPITVDLKL